MFLSAFPLKAYHPSTLSQSLLPNAFFSVPLKVYLKHGFAKVLIGVGQGKKQYDKRQTIKKRDQDREIHRKYGI